MILYFRITRERKEALLSLYSDIKSFVEKTIENTADKIIIERDNFNIDKELAAYHDRRILNGNDIRSRRMTQATKDKISKSLKAKGWEGIPLLEETKEKLRGHTVTKETRDKISKRNSGQKRTLKQRQNISIAKTGQKYKKRKGKVN